MPYIDRDVAERATRLEQETKRLLKLAEETKRNVLQASYKLLLMWQVEQRRN